MGALVVGVEDDGPAKDAGIKVGDLIVGFDGKEVPTMRDLPRIVAETEIGKSVETIPAVTVPPSPNGLPIAITQSPTRMISESPQLT